MGNFKKYQHIERFGTDETEHIELGECYVFPKLDGTNASVWLHDGAVCCGSRNRELSLDNDNAGFMAWATNQIGLAAYLSEHPSHRLFGEWLVPHSLNTYREDAWRQFYVFDVVEDLSDGEMTHEHAERFRYIPYLEYKPLLEAHGINYVPPISIITNSNYEQLVEQLHKNVFLIEDGKGVGEGVVLKRYGYKNRFGRSTWAKIVTSEFRERHAKVMGAPQMPGRKMIEEEIVDKYVTKALCEKELAKIKVEAGWSSKMIPRLLGTVYHALISEECWHFVKEHKNPRIDFGRIDYFTIAKVKQHLPELF